ncbi:MAG: hypothetical protein FWE50_04515 [Alphaproteobacteria bacterium]|nr:hypothetical protein [Alphaproteobacteria bacterium]
MRKNLKRKVALGVGMFLLLFATSCKKSENCALKPEGYKDLQNKEAEWLNEFNKNADSCLVFYGNQLPEDYKAFMESELSDYPQPPTQRDRVEALIGVSSCNGIRVNGNLICPDAKILDGVRRTGKNALDAWIEYAKAQKNTNTYFGLWQHCL